MQARHNIERLEKIATRLRLQVVNMVAPSGQGYVQQGLGAADIFTSLYFAEASLDPGNPAWPGRDRIFLTTSPQHRDLLCNSGRARLFRYRQA